MQRHEMIDALGQLGLKGMAAAFDDAVTTGLQRKRTAMEILADLVKAEAAHRQAASIRYRITAAKLPVMKDLARFTFEGSPINEDLVRALHGGSFLADHRNIVLIGGTGSVPFGLMCSGGLQACHRLRKQARRLTRLVCSESPGCHAGG